MNIDIIFNSFRIGQKVRLWQGNVHAEVVAHTGTITDLNHAGIGLLDVEHQRIIFLPWHMVAEVEVSVTIVDDE